MKNLSILPIIFVLFSCSIDKSSSVSQEDPKPLTKDERMSWWRDARFGMFIHWGPYAVPAGIHEGEETTNIAEWIMNTNQIPIARYEEYSRQFVPNDFNADEWVSIAKNAGMKYIVITSKHHDGFCIWDSKITEYDIMDFSPFGRDILQELKTACDKQGIKLGFYHSIMDWHHPQAQAINEPKYHGEGAQVNPEFQTYITNYMKPQIKELIEKYDPAIMWFDGEWIDDFTHEQGMDLHEFVMELKPDILVNNRVDKGRQGMQGMNKEGDYRGDFGTPEQEILESTSDYDWESCMTMNDTWGFNQTDDNWKSDAQLVHNLVDVVAKGGNYLLNVGPTAKGLIPEASADRLASMGEWLAVNGESIYNTQSINEYRLEDSVRVVKSKTDNIYYLTQMNELPSDLSFSLPLQQGIKASLLGFDGELGFETSSPGQFKVTVPAEAQEMWQTQRAWVIKVE